MVSENILFENVVVDDVVDVVGVGIVDVVVVGNGVTIVDDGFGVVAEGDVTALALVLGVDPPEPDDVVKVD